MFDRSPCADKIGSHIAKLLKYFSANAQGTLCQKNPSYKAYVQCVWSLMGCTTKHTSADYNANSGKTMGNIRIMQKSLHPYSFMESNDLLP